MNDADYSCFLWFFCYMQKQVLHFIRHLFEKKNINSTFLGVSSCLDAIGNNVPGA